MLLIEIIDSRGQPQTIWGGRVIVRDAATGTPIAVAAVTGQRSFEASVASAHDFETALLKLGIPPVQIVDGKRLKAKPGIR